jgi:hypothetical protein
VSESAISCPYSKFFINGIKTKFQRTLVESLHTRNFTLPFEDFLFSFTKKCGPRLERQKTHLLLSKISYAFTLKILVKFYINDFSNRRFRYLKKLKTSAFSKKNTEF